jgi:hypothetical protein
MHICPWPTIVKRNCGIYVLNLIVEILCKDLLMGRWVQWICRRPESNRIGQVRPLRVWVYAGQYRRRPFLAPVSSHRDRQRLSPLEEAAPGLHSFSRLRPIIYGCRASSGDSASAVLDMSSRFQCFVEFHPLLWRIPTFVGGVFRHYSGRFFSSSLLNRYLGPIFAIGVKSRA